MSSRAESRACLRLRRMGCGLAIGFAGCCLLWMFACKPPAALASANANWGAGVEAGAPANASPTPQVALTSVSCPSAGNCAASGRYFDSSGHSQGLLQSQSSGAWAAGIEAPLPANAGANPATEINSVSCASEGDCSAVANYRDSSNNRQGVLWTESSGAWATGVGASLPADAPSQPFVSFSSVSCASAGDCSAVGGYVDGSGSSQGLLMTETAGTWGTGVEAGLPADAGAIPNVGLTSVSCPSAGNCSAVGTYADSSGATQGLLLTESSGAWATGLEVSLPGIAAADPIVAIPPVSCSSAGNCSAVGTYTDSSGHREGVLLSETAGVWATGVEAQLSANAASNPMVILNSVSCASAGTCTVAGVYDDSSGPQGLLLTAAPLSPTLSASAPASATAGSPVSASLVSATLAGGAAPIGTVAFKVFGPQSSPPGSCTSGGTMVGSASVSGNATYHPSAGFAPATPGDYWWHASYGGDPSDKAAASACGAGMAKTIVAPPSQPPGPPPGPPGTKLHRPTLSAVNLGSKRFAARKGTKLKLTVSQAAAIRVLITRAVKGRRISGACKRGAKAGKRCTTTITKRTLRFSAKAGANAFKLRLRGLPTGKYTAAVTAQNANGRSGTVKRKFTIARR